MLSPSINPMSSTPWFGLAPRSSDISREVRGDDDTSPHRPDGQVSCTDDGSSMAVRTAGCCTVDMYDRYPLHLCMVCLSMVERLETKRLRMSPEGALRHILKITFTLRNFPNIKLTITNTAGTLYVSSLKTLLIILPLFNLHPIPGTC